MFKKWPLKKIVLMSSLLCLFLAGKSLSADGIKSKTMTIYPSIDIGGKQETNIFLTSEKLNDKESDFIVTINPRLKIDIPFRKNLFKLDYNFEMLRYSDYSGQDADNHIVAGLFEFNFNKFKININDQYKDVNERPNSEFIDRIRYYQNDLNTGISFLLSRVNIDLGVQNTQYNYFNKQWSGEDRTESVYKFQLGYRFFPKTIIFMEYNQGNIKYDMDSAVNPDSDYTKGMIGLKGKLTSKCEGTVKLGSQSSEYKDSTSHPDFSTMVTSINLKETFNYKNTLNLNINRQAIESTYKTNNYYTVNKVLINYLYKMTNMFATEFSSFYQLNLYPQETTEGSEIDKREDTLVNGGIKFKYKIIKWLSLDVGFAYEQRDSIFDIFDYTNIITSFNLSAKY